MIVDCGLNQGDRYADDLNYEPLGYDPSTVGYVFVTHSHIDHIGRLPLLYKLGFRGKVFTSAATKDLMELALPDNLGHIASEAKELGKEPLYDEGHLEGLLRLVHTVEYGKPFEIGAGVRITFHDAGHILGSSIIEIEYGEDGKQADTAEVPTSRKRIFFSGDLGNPPTLLLKTTENIKNADYIVIESAYGDRTHESGDERRAKLAQIIKDTFSRPGTLMIPSFALERTQDLLFELHQMNNRGEIPQLPIFMDSPLAIKMTEIYRRHIKQRGGEHETEFNKQVMELSKGGEDIFKFPGLILTENVEASKGINNVAPPKVIIAGSGMSQGGRILHHEARYLSDPNSTILFVGYQVDGSLGRRIQRGEKQVRIFGNSVDVKCRVETITSYSAHADQPALLSWVKHASQGGRLKKVFVVQGEEAVAKTLANLIRDQLSISAYAPKPAEAFDI